MIKLVLFDLDGVLIDAKDIHYECLNRALGEYAISREDHIKIYDGYKTRQKLKMLTEKKGLPLELYNVIYEHKQKYTQQEILKLKPIPHIIELFEKLKDDGYLIGVCTNSIRTTAFTALAVSKLIQYCSIVISNEDVKNGKPHPEMYWNAISTLNMLPEETVIIEDSVPGLLAAKRSGAKIIQVDNPNDVTIDNIIHKILNI